MDSKTEPASEKEQAIWMANNLLDEPNADPDDDARTISRQFLRALEEITRLKAELEREIELRKELVNCIETYVDLELFANPKPIESLIEKAKKLTMEKTDKSAEEILRSVGNGVISKSVAIKAMELYAAQQNSEYKEVIKELLPIAERMQSACESGETLCYDNDLDLSDAKNYKSAIDRAKALLQESNQGQPPQESEQP